MGLKLAAASGGSIELVPTNTASNFTVTVPAKTGAMAMDGPAFSAYQSSGTSLSASTYTKVQFQTKEFDTNTNYDNATNYRFTPTVAGYYQINASVRATQIGEINAIIYKNGSSFKVGSDTQTTVTNNFSSIVSALVFLNGSTDYVEIYVYSQNAVTSTAGQQYTYFQASMVRGA
jgi:hypothetical protein